MKMKIINSLVILAMVLALPVLTTGSVASVGAVVAKEPVAIGALTRSGDHLVMPRDEVIFAELIEEGALGPRASQEEIDVAIKDYKLSFAKKSDTWVNPQIEAQAEAREAILGNAAAMAPEAVQPVDVTIFSLAVDFDESVDETVYFDDVYSVDGCDLGVILNDTFAGPLVGNIPYPDPIDNNTVWYDPSLYSGVGDASWYNNLIYGYDGVGRIRTDEAARGETGDEILTDPRDGLPGIDLTGYTVQDYYDHVAGAGNVTLYGDTFGWVTVDHPEAYYGADACNGSHYGGAYTFDGVEYTSIPVSTLVLDAVTEFNAANPGFDWAEYDQNEDGIVDTFWIIYAGMGQEAGGGSQGDFALWSHSSDTRYYFGEGRGILVSDGGTPDPADDIYVGPYTMQPENSDVGVMSEEFGHNVFGLPDLYVTDVQGSIAFWSIMESGAWGGYLGGATPVSMPLWFKMIAWCDVGYCNWHLPMLTRDYDDPGEWVDIAQLEQQAYDATRPDWGPTTPDTSGMMNGVRINLPPVEEVIPNNAGTGNAAWSGYGNDSDLTLTRSITLPSVGANLLTVESYWDIEEDYDYGYFEVFDTGLGAWVDLADEGGNCDPGSVLGCGLTGFGMDTLAYDLSAYAGTTIDIRFRYYTDPFVNGTGWWLDDLALDGILIENFEGASTPDIFPGWTNDGWDVTPFTTTHTQYYLVEWRNETKYDQMVQTAYVTTDSGDNLWRVERVPYNIPGALLYYRNTQFGGTYAQVGNYPTPPSYGPKYQLLVVDMNFMPVPVGNWGETGYVFNARVGSYDAALTLDPTEYFELSKVNGIDPTTYPGPFEYPSKSAVTTFNDAQQYYSGYRSNTNGTSMYVGLHDSAVIPARDLYSAGVWDRATGQPVWWWELEYAWEKAYGGSDPYGVSWLGNGAPGYDNVQFGVNIELDGQGSDGEYGSLYIYNYSVDFPITVSGEFEGSEYILTTALDITNQGPRYVYDVWAEAFLDYDLCWPEDAIEVTAFSDLNGEVPVYLEYDYDWDQFYFYWESLEEGLAPGETVSVVATCTVPVDMVGEFDFETETWFYAFDGQIDRGEKIVWFDSYLNRYVLPMMFSVPLP